MTRAHTWMMLALAVGCSSENTDGANPLPTTDPSSTLPAQPSGPVGSTTPGPTTSAPVLPPPGPTGGTGPGVEPGPVPPVSPTTAPMTSTTAPADTSTAPATSSEEPDVTSAPVSETSEAPIDETSDEPAPTPGECVKGTTAGNEVVFIGESFIAASTIPEETAKLAIANGSLKQGEQYHDFSVSGTRLGDGAIPRQYTQAQAQHDIRFVLMNGGGNDCLQANDPNAPIPAAEKLFQEMAADGIEKVVYFFYPDAAGAFAGQLQGCLNEYRPKIKALCDGLTAPKCYWVDLAETEWKGNESAFTTDGIHPNAQGSVATAKAIWGAMVENCVAQ